MFAFLNCSSVSHLFDFSSAGLWVLKPVSSRKINSPKSYRTPKPDPTASSLKSSNPSKRLLGSVTSSKTFQIFPTSVNNAPLNDPNRLKRYSTFSASLKFASLNSFPENYSQAPNDRPPKHDCHLHHQKSKSD